MTAEKENPEEEKEEEILLSSHLLDRILLGKETEEESLLGSFLFSTRSSDRKKILENSLCRARLFSLDFLGKRSPEEISKILSELSEIPAVEQNFLKAHLAWQVLFAKKISEAEIPRILLSWASDFRGEIFRDPSSRKFPSHPHSSRLSAEEFDREFACRGVSCLEGMSEKEFSEDLLSRISHSLFFFSDVLSVRFFLCLPSEVCQFLFLRHLLSRKSFLSLCSCLHSSRDRVLAGKLLLRFFAQLLSSEDLAGEKKRAILSMLSSEHLADLLLPRVFLSKIFEKDPALGERLAGCESFEEFFLLLEISGMTSSVDFISLVLSMAFRIVPWKLEDAVSVAREQLNMHLDLSWV